MGVLGPPQAGNRQPRRLPPQAPRALTAIGRLLVWFDSPSPVPAAWGAFLRALGGMAQTRLFAARTRLPLAGTAEGPSTSLRTGGCPT
jgi:hypothetical protein